MFFAKICYNWYKVLSLDIYLNDWTRRNLYQPSYYKEDASLNKRLFISVGSFHFKTIRELKDKSRTHTTVASYSISEIKHKYSNLYTINRVCVSKLSISQEEYDVRTNCRLHVGKLPSIWLMIKQFSLKCWYNIRC